MFNKQPKKHITKLIIGIILSSLLIILFISLNIFNLQSFNKLNNSNTTTEKIEHNTQTAKNLAAFKSYQPLIFYNSLATKPYKPCDFTIGLDIKTADARKDYKNVKAGDIVCLEAGTRGGLKIRNFRGTEENPIIFKNINGQVIVDSSDGYGIFIQNSKYFRLTGTTGNGPNTQYGIKIIDSNTKGIQVAYKSSYFEIDHIEITGVPDQGISAQSHPVCSDGSTNYWDFDNDGKIDGDVDDIVNRQTFIQHNTHIHHNYIHDVGAEAIYVGNSHYDTGDVENCDSGTETVYAPKLIGVDIHHNYAKNLGWNGIQVGSAVENCQIHHNFVFEDSQKGKSGQLNGIMNNPGSVCHIYQNFIKDGNGPGIYLQGSGNNIVYNNIIINPGQFYSKGDGAGNGITISSGTISNDQAYIYIWHNTIIRPVNYGIKFRNDYGTVDTNKIQNNIIVQPGNFDTDGEEGYIDSDSRINLTKSYNFTTMNINEIKFMNESEDNYHLLSTSAALEKGIDLADQGLNLDYDGLPRPRGSGTEPGAFEY